MMANAGTTPRRIGVGIAGTGFIGPAHLEGLRRNNVHVIGLAESSAELAQQKARELGLERGYLSYEAMLADPDIDVVHLATPNYLHYPHAKAALLAGKHVVCEKPLAMSSQQSAELVRLAAEKGLVNAVNFNIRFYPLVHQARSLVQSGELGDLFIIQGSYLQDWLLFPTDWNWRLEPGLGGTLRAVGDIGSHWLDLITFVTGLRIERVFADFKTFLPVRKKPARPVETFTGKLLTPEDYIDQPIHTEDYATILLHFQNGVRGVLTVSQVSAGRKNRLYYEISGAKSALAWDSERPNELWLGSRTGPNQILMKDPSLLSPEARAVASYPGGHNEGFPDTFKQLSKKVYGYLQAGDFSTKPDFPTFADGHYEMLLCEAIEKSAREGVWVDISDERIES
jgi:predicted dehydrogenase